MGIILYLVPKTTATVAALLLIIFGLLIHPIWKFWWIEQKLWRKLAATLLLIFGLVRIWYISQPADADAALLFAKRHLGSAWRWVDAPHGRWLDKVIGGVYALLALFLILFFAAVIQAFRKRKVLNQQCHPKGFLEYKLDVETAVAAISPMLDDLAKIMTEVAPTLIRHSAALIQAASGPTAQQVKIVKEAASSLDGYTRRVDNIRNRYVENGKLLSEGFLGWSAWVSKTPPAKAGLSSVAEVLRHFTNNVGEANERLNAYLTTMVEIKGASSVLDAAIDRHVISWGAISMTNGGIFEASKRFLVILDGS